MGLRRRMGDIFGEEFACPEGAPDARLSRLRFDIQNSTIDTCPEPRRNRQCALMPTRAVLLRLMLWSLGLAAATGVLAVLFQGGDLVWRVVGTGIATAAACGLLIPTSVLIDRERTRAGGLLGMAVVILEFLLALGLIWELLQGFLSGA